MRTAVLFAGAFADPAIAAAFAQEFKTQRIEIFRGKVNAAMGVSWPLV